MLPEIDLLASCTKPVETMCRTFNLNKPFKSYIVIYKTVIYKTFVAAILDFSFLCIPAKYLHGYPPRLFSRVGLYVEIIATDI